jgi:hypothetical protein
MKKNVNVFYNTFKLGHLTYGKMGHLESIAGNTKEALPLNK